MPGAGSTFTLNASSEAWSPREYGCEPYLEPARIRVRALLGARENIVPISCHVQLSRVRKRNQSSNGDLSALRHRPDDVCRRVAACGEAIAAKNSAAMGHSA